MKRSDVRDVCSIPNIEALPQFKKPLDHLSLPQFEYGWNRHGVAKLEAV